MLASRIFSAGRTRFSTAYANERPLPIAIDHPGVNAWGLHLRLPLWNAAGMFKKGEAYEVVSAQGAGAYVAGTTTSRPRAGNTSDGIQWPAVVYARSRAASNWMGLPNEGHDVVAERLSQLQRHQGCPIGASVSAEPGLEEESALPELVVGLFAYDRAGVDYIELNESCPNVPSAGHGPSLSDDLIRRLEYVSREFLSTRKRSLPVVVKFSVDTNPEQLEELLDRLVQLQFDGVILGNTSIRYDEMRNALHPADHKLYDRFVDAFGGGLSGEILKTDSLALSSRAVKIIEELKPEHEFHVIRCGGVSSADDLKESLDHGVILNQWYAGYFESFAANGHRLYEVVASQLRA